MSTVPTLQKIEQPETILKKRKQDNKAREEKLAKAAEAKKAQKAKRAVIFKRAEQYVKEYRVREAEEVRLKRVARANGDFYVPPQSKVYFAIRLRGVSNIAPKPRKIMQLLRLLKINSGVFIKVNKATEQMLKMVEPYVAYGEPNLKSIRELVYKRGYGKVNKQRVPLQDNAIIEKELGQYDILSIEDCIHEIATAGPHFKQVTNFLWPFHLSSANGGYRQRKLLHFVEGGDVGNREKVSQRKYDSLPALSSAISSAAFSYQGVEALNLRLSKSKGLLKGELSYEENYDNGECVSITKISNIDVDIIIGIHPWERQFKQKVLLDLTIKGNHDYNLLIQRLVEFLEQSDYHVLENLALDAARLAIVDLKLPEVTIKAAKPSALTFADSASVQVTRTSKDFNIIENVTASQATPVVLSFGSNLGNQKLNIQKALNLLESRGVAKVVDTSFLYQTKPMYVIDQPTFLNGVCKISTSLTPHGLLKSIKEIEEDLGRDLGGPVKGPRPIDLDILVFGDQKVNDDVLNIPHIGISERSFVLKPFCDVLPDFIPPGHLLTSTEALQRLNDDSIKMALAVGQKLISLRDKRWVMGILNCTPDSFSDGGLNYTLEDSYKNAVKMIEDGVDFIDVGGMSTRPNAPDVEPEVEIDRVVPIIAKLRKEYPEVIISVDTFRAAVAKAAVEAGADIINDVSGGLADEDMFKTVAELGVPYILMHMRGDSRTMTSLTHYSEGVVEGVKHEMQERLKMALESGIRRWNIIIDPGLGFAKDVDGNLDILRNLDAFGGRSTKQDNKSNGFLTQEAHLELANMPLLIGHSRKKFIGTITDVGTAKDRVAGTAATTMAALSGGADIVRVHDVKETIDVTKMAQAM
ncbi:hypothetical protein E3Q23_00784 [Wallemia mellicola]|nr:hypothetical protein E3Q23_00784 [Wallemia mellicola]TIC16338.1 Dihydropteroate synthase [Wallemia mellicola]TIC33239.1 Dihydropteroate synthase [Wallemia mellicola]